MGRLNKLNSWVRNIPHRFLGFLEDRLAPLTLIVFVAVLIFSILFWDAWRGEESGSTAIRNLFLVIAAIVALPLAIWRSKVAERQAETAHRGLLNERYQKGAEMLGSEVLSVRLGGIYALARLARAHPGDYHTQIMSLLCAFVRNPPGVGKEKQDTKKLREDVQAIMPAICVRSELQIEIEEKEFYFNLDLSGADLHGVSLLRVASLGNSNLQPRPGISANLKGAFLSCSNLSGAHLVFANLKDAQFFGANLEGAFLSRSNLSGADLRDCKGLTQDQIDQAVARPPDKPPSLEDLVDAKTGKPLVWRGGNYEPKSQI